ncbi:MAG: YchJ family protein [Myxococcales bacterium]|nr:YchJ family protein [Myxococcales bacterium]
MTCPCGKGESLETCCGPFLAGQKKPRSAEELMRSRYTAFTQGDVDYILKTHDPDTVHQVDRESTEQWAKQSEWLGFELLSVQGGTPEEFQGTIEFVARYRLKGAQLEHRERATFRRQDDTWFFVDGEQIAGPPVRREGPKVGRNDPCTCGSGKKFKKCCGLAA